MWTRTILLLCGMINCSNLQDSLPDMSGSSISGCVKHLLYYIKTYYFVICVACATQVLYAGGVSALWQVFKHGTDRLILHETI